ncbi:hypothetical protein Tco_1278775 [Tanacetum coccineum]
MREAFTIASTQYVEYLVDFWNALRAHYLPHSNEYVSPPSLVVVRPWFATIEYNREIGDKGTLKKSCLPPRWRLLMAEIIQCLGGKTGRLDQILNNDATILYCLEKEVQVDFAKIIWEDIILKLNKKTREKVVPTLDTELHKEDLQAAGDPTFLGVSSKEGAHPQLSSASGCDASVDSTADADPRKYAPNDPIPSQQGMDEGTKNYLIDHIFARTNSSVLVDKTKYVLDGLKTAHTISGTNEELGSEEMSKKIKMKDLSHLMQDTRSAFFTPNSLLDEPPLHQMKVKRSELKDIKNLKTLQFHLLHLLNLFNCKSCWIKLTYFSLKRTS